MTQVLVCGGGPVGLTLALGLAAWQVPVTLVERHPSPLPFPKGRALSTRTMEIYRQLGLEGEVTAAGLPRSETMHFFYGESVSADRFTRISNTPPPGGSPLSPTFTLACSQDVLETILRRRAAEHPLIDTHFGASVVDASIADEGSTVTVREPSGRERRLDCRWLVAADGAASMLRSLAGIELDRTGPDCDNVNILFDADLADVVADRRSLVFTLSNDRVHATVLTVDGRRRWLCNVIRPDTTDPDAAARDRAWCTARVHDALGRPVEVDIVDAMVWNATAANARTYQRGSMVLVGDAAHIATPYGGFGMNCGVADAHNLAWKLAAVLVHGHPDDLVGTYHSERHPIGERTVRESAVRLGASLDAHRDGRTRRGEITANPSDGLVLGGTYRSAAVLGGEPGDVDDTSVTTYTPSARPGARAPHAWLADGRSTLDLFGPHLTVLHHTSATPDPPAAFGSLPTVAVPIDDTLDPTGAVRSRYGIDRGGAVVVRPDGHVMWAASTPTSPQ